MARKKRSVANRQEEAAAPIHGEYEQIRLARMAENQKRLQQLGLADMSEAMFKQTRKKQPKKLSVPRSYPEPIRKSARLQNNPPPRYSELTEREVRDGGGKRGSGRDANKAGAGGSVPEVYTEEHERMLGDVKEEWTLFKDGYVNGERVYDRARGKTCHQCRQKTLGRRTYCGGCQALQGQFCGDCLYMRYGENVMEALANENWKCPACRDICNCSICRNRKGWAPTGSLYRRAIKLGYKSVAHFLILTRRGEAAAVVEASAAADDQAPEPDEEPGYDEELSPCEDEEEEVPAVKTKKPPAKKSKTSKRGKTGKTAAAAAAKEEGGEEVPAKKTRKRGRGAAAAAVSDEEGGEDAPAAAKKVKGAPITIFSDSEEEEGEKPKRQVLTRQRVQPPRAVKAC